MIGTLLLVALQSLFPEGSTQSDLKVASMLDYQNCLYRESVALERSNADFDDIYEAAQTSCASQWADLHDKAMKDFEARTDFEGDAMSAATNFTDRIEEGAKAKIRLAFLRLRTARNAK